MSNYTKHTKNFEIFEVLSLFFHDWLIGYRLMPICRYFIHFRTRTFCTKPPGRAQNFMRKLPECIILHSTLIELLSRYIWIGLNSCWVFVQLANFHRSVTVFNTSRLWRAHLWTAVMTAYQLIKWCNEPWTTTQGPDRPARLGVEMTAMWLINWCN